MTEPYFGEIQVFAFDFAPVDWAFCNGATLPMTQYMALYSLLGITYGGNGSTTFMLPNLTSRAPGGTGAGPGLTPRSAGNAYGEFQHALTVQEMPSHGHSATVYVQRDQTKRTSVPAAGSAVVSPSTTAPFVPAGVPSTSLYPMALQPAGSGLPHENRQPFLALNFCIALQGVYPDFN
ncbi:MAG: tail fiber protein [Luteibacter sp.]|uniref:phage tail protein n=1 Tax=unclassified Luteibacter TaxID=2620188 RepID=UPI0005BDB7CC|nr:MULTISPECIES: tail fiber protein [unclassified Luteibacter]MDQ7996384.1 tail fiber protein [Luteibacter sp.]MDQ8047988.1 tail fiber protein [Luteibacter sp.]